MAYFSEKELGPKPRTIEEVTHGAWRGIAAVILTRIADGSFGVAFPQECPDGHGPYGTNSYLLGQAVQSEFPYLEWPLEPERLPNTYDVLDFVQFCYGNVARALLNGEHTYYGHTHLTFDVAKGRQEFRAVINRIFARNELAFELQENGEIIRLAPVVLREALASATFSTGDTTLDSLLEAARMKFLSHDTNVRQESLEKLWDAWERAKTIEPGRDKKESAKLLLDRAANEPNFREVLEIEARALTQVGNDFLIRHTEVGKVQIERSEHVDYLFHRLFALIRLALKSSGRGG